MSERVDPAQSERGLEGCPISENEEGCCGDFLDCASREQLKAEVVRLRQRIDELEEREEDRRQDWLEKT